MSASDLPILVAGAGIAGLTTALSLSRDGHSVTVLERRTRVDEVGAGIQLSPNASRILVGLGLGPALTRAGCEPDRLVIRRGRGGEAVAEMPLGTAMRERYGAPYYVVHRADLQMLLLDKVRANPRVRLVFGREVVDARAFGPGVQVTTEATGGRETWTGRLLVGADGVWSATAKLIAGHTAPDFSGCVAWRALVPMEDVPPPLRKRETNLWLGPSAHVVTYPLRGGKVLNIVAVTQDRTAEPDWSRPGDAETLRRKLRGWASDLQHLLRLVPDWQVWSLYDHLGRVWRKDRMILIGDAAHPVLPFLAQGGALAIEDAAALAHALRERSADLAQTLAAFEAERRPRALRVQKAARSNARAYHLPMPLSLARDMVLRRLGSEGLRQRYDWLYGWTPPGA